MISSKASHNNLMSYTQQSVLNTVKNNRLPEDIRSSLVSRIDIFRVLIKQYHDYPYDRHDDLVDSDKLIHLMVAVRDCEWSDDSTLTISVQFNDLPGFYDWMDYPDHLIRLALHTLGGQKGTVWVYDQDDAFFDIKTNMQAECFTGLKKLVQFIDSVRTDYKCVLLERHMPLLRLFPERKECMHVEKWLREMPSIPETGAPIKQALAHGLSLRLKSIYPVFPESLVMLLLSILGVETYRDDVRLSQWISNRVQGLDDKYYPINRHVKIRCTLQFRKGSTCKLLFHLRVDCNVDNHPICISVCQLAFHLFFRRYFVVTNDTSLEKALVVASQPCGV